MMSSAGILLLQSHCSCTGNDNVSLYVTPETCAENYHIHHTHNEIGQEVPSEAADCHECTDHTTDCGCNNISVIFHKLDNEIVQEKVRIESKEPVNVINTNVLVFLFSRYEDVHPASYSTYTGPPIVINSFDFLIEIQQLKISCLA